MSHNQDYNDNNNNQFNNNEPDPFLLTPSAIPTPTHHYQQQQSDQQSQHSTSSSTTTKPIMNTSTSTNHFDLSKSTSTTTPKMLSQPESGSLKSLRSAAPPSPLSIVPKQNTTPHFGSTQQPSPQNTAINNNNNTINNSFSQRSQSTTSPSFSRLGSSTTSSITSFSRHGSSFAKSWSMQYVNGEIVPPITTSTLRREDCGQPYKTSRTHNDYIPFWYLQASFFLMFTAYSLVLNLLTTVYGPSTALALAILYFFFVLSAIVMPAVNSFVFKNNTTATMFCGSLGYSFMMFCSIFGAFPLLLIASIMVGSVGSFVWVSYSSVISIMARNIAEQAFLRDITDRLHKRMKTTIQTQELNDIKVHNLIQQLQLPNGRINLLKITDEQTKRILLTTAETISWLTSVGWMLNSTSAVLGSFISWLMLTFFKSDDPVTSAQRLFILFFFFGLIANVFYYLTYLKTPISMFASNEQPLQIDQHDETRVNDNVDIVDAIDQKGNIIFHSQSGMLNTKSEQSDGIRVTTSQQQHDQYILHTVPEGHNEEDEDDIEKHIPQQQESSEQSPTSPTQTTPLHPNHDSSSSTPPSTPIPTTPTSSSPTTSPIDTTSPLETLQRSLFMMKLMLQQRPIALSMISFYQMLLPISLTVSFFTANAVRPTLGLNNVPLIMMTVYGVDSITAFVLSRIMKGFMAGRWFGIAGSFIQLIFIVLILLLPSSEWIDPNQPTNLSRAWTYSLLIGVISGIGDGCLQAGHTSSLGILAEGSTLVRSAAFGLGQAFKSMGSITIFLTGRFVSFPTQCIIVLIIVVISIGVQFLNIMFHLPLDMDYLMVRFNEFVSEQIANRKNNINNNNNNNNSEYDHNTNIYLQNEQNKPSSFPSDGTTLDELGTTDS